VDTVLGRYRLGPRLGAGGFGTVYAGHDERLDRPVAVKVIPAGARAPERAQREAMAVARLDHPGVVAVFDAGEDAEARYLVSELVHGRTLDRLAADGALSDRDVVRIGLALADALGHAHARGVVHRDVKPQNVIVPDAPREARAVAKLADFGVAHLAGDDPLTRTGDVVGTLAYMAPEQAAGQRVGPAADLYALALVLYEGLAGVNPVRAAGPAATARRLGTALPSLRRARPELPAGLIEALDRALRPRPEERGTLDELSDALLAALPAVDDRGGTVAPHPLERRALPPAAARALAGAGAGGLAAVAAAAVPDPAITPAVAAAAAALLVAALPRAGWLAVAAAAVAALAGPRPDLAVLVAAAAVPVPLLAARDPTAWSLPALAPLLGPAGLAGAYPALAGRLRRATARAALGALGAWWLALSVPARAHDPPGGAAALRTVLEGGALAYAAVWAAAAVLLPWLVRGRSLAIDVVCASAWAAGLAAATGAVARRLEAAEPRGLVLGAVAAGALAVALARSRAEYCRT
jgi:eukaryotic-like serine/threonine-protein kinase